MMKTPTATILALYLGILLFLPACVSMKRLAPAAGATAGAAAGAPGGVATAALGGAAGYAIGEVVATDIELREAEAKFQEAHDTIEALTKGDVEGLLAARLQEAEKSWGEKVISEIKGLLKLAAWVILFLTIAFVVVTIFLHKTGIKVLKADVFKDVQKTLHPFPQATARGNLEVPRTGNQPAPPQ